MSRDFARKCQTPILVLPDDTASQPNPTSVDIASLAPNAEVTVYPWKDHAPNAGFFMPFDAIKINAC